MSVKARVTGSPDYGRSYRRDKYGMSFESATWWREVGITRHPSCASTMALHDWAQVTHDGVTVVMCGDCGRFPSEIAAAWEI